MNVEKCYCVIHIKTNGTSWANSNEFRSIWGYGPKYLALFEHVGTYTAGASGPNGNIFEDVAMQALTPGGGNNVIGGIIDVFGQYNTFNHCSVWDIANVSPGTPSMTICSNADGTVINGGVLTHATFTDNGVDTMINDKWQGLYSKNSTTLKNTLTLTKSAQSSTDETLFNFTVDDAPGDSFTLANSTAINGIFAPLFRSTQNSSASPDWAGGLYLQVLTKAANDTTTTGAIILAGHSVSGNAYTNRPIVSIENKFTPISPTKRFKTL